MRWRSAMFDGTEAYPIRSANCYYNSPTCAIEKHINIYVFAKYVI